MKSVAVESAEATPTAEPAGHIATMRIRPPPEEPTTAMKAATAKATTVEAATTAKSPAVTAASTTPPGHRWRSQGQWP